jgi:hypothetical protein
MATLCQEPNFVWNLQMCSNRTFQVAPVFRFKKADNSQPDSQVLAIKNATIQP